MIRRLLTGKMLSLFWVKLTLLEGPLTGVVAWPQIHCILLKEEWTWILMETCGLQIFLIAVHSDMIRRLLTRRAVRPGRVEAAGVFREREALSTL